MLQREYNAAMRQAHSALRCDALQRHSAAAMRPSRLSSNKTGLQIIGLRVPINGLSVVIGLRVPIFGLRVPIFGLRVPIFELRVPIIGRRVPVFVRKVRDGRELQGLRDRVPRHGQHPRAPPQVSRPPARPPAATMCHAMPCRRRCTHAVALLLLHAGWCMLHVARF
jgi:hypothetical protein